MVVCVCAPPSPFQHGQQLYRHIYLGCKEEDNNHKNFELLFTTLAIVTIELANEEVVIDLIRLSIALQVTAALFVKKNNWSAFADPLTLTFAGNVSDKRGEHAHVHPLWHHGIRGSIPQLLEPDDCQPPVLSTCQQGESPPPLCSGSLAQRKISLLTLLFSSSGYRDEKRGSSVPPARTHFQRQVSVSAEIPV